MRRRDMLRVGLLAGGTAGLHPFAAHAAEAHRGGTLVFATGTDAQTLDPQFVTDIPTSRVVRAIYEPLTVQDEAGKLQPCLATSWTTSDDKRTWTFRLREGVTFHDGTPFDAAAVKFTFDRLRDPVTGSPRASSLDAVESVTVVDPQTVAITTTKPYAPLLAQLSAYNVAIISPSKVRSAGARFREQPAGTGPFRLRSWSVGERCVVARNDAYWGAKPLLDAVEFRAVPEASARALLLLTGEADVVANPPAVMLQRLQASPAVQVVRKTGFRTIVLGINTTLKPFDDLRVRQAVAHAVDVKSILAGVLSGIGTLGGGYESPVIPGAISLPPYPFDPDRARKLLAEAGLPSGFQTRFYVPSGMYQMDRQLGEAIQAQLGAVGIKVDIQSPDVGTYTSLVYQKKTAPLFIGGKGSPTGDLDLTLTLSDATGGRMNFSSLSDPELDELILAQRSAIDPNERAALLRKAQERIYQDVPVVVLFYEDQLFGMRANIRDVGFSVNEFVDFSRASKG